MIGHGAIEASEKLPFTTVLLTTTCITPMLRTNSALRVTNPAHCTLMMVELLAPFKGAFEHAIVVRTSELLAFETPHLTSKKYVRKNMYTL